MNENINKMMCKIFKDADLMQTDAKQIIIKFNKASDLNYAKKKLKSEFKTTVHMNEKIQIVFLTEASENTGFIILGRLRQPFTYEGNGKYVITREQYMLLKANDLEVPITKYYDR